MGRNMPSSDKVLASSVAKGATRELSNKGANIGNMSQGASALPKDKGPTTDPGKAVVTKRQNIDAPSSPGYHNVYVRRKVESEHNKVNSFQELKGNGKDKIKEQEAPLQDVQHDEVNKPQVASPVDKPVEVELVPVDKPVEVELVSSEKTNVETVPEKTNVETVPEKPNVETVPEKPNVETVPEKPNVETMPEKTELPAASAAGKQDDAEQLSIQYWNERFNRLQTYLENCDRSTQEGYLRKLRSLSAVGRSMHAIELEKRAIHLLVEEGKELQRMKALNVLGKVSPNVSSKQMPLQRQL